MAIVKLGEIARESKLSYKGDKSNMKIVGLEHLTPESVTLTEWSENTENTFTKRFLKGQVLFGRRRAYLKKAAVAPFDGICSGDITVIEAIPGKINEQLLPFIIQNEKFFDYAVEKSAGSLSPRVKWEHLKDYEFELPDMAEQERLAKILWAAEDELNAAKKAIFKIETELLPTYIKDKYDNNSQNGYCKLFDVGEIICGYPFDSAKFTTEKIGFPLIRIRDIVRGYTETYFTGIYENKYLVNKDNILIGMDGEFNVSMWSSSPALLNQRLSMVLPDERRFINEYVYYYIKRELKQKEDEIVGTTVKHLSISDIREVKLPIKNLEEQREIVKGLKFIEKIKLILLEKIILLKNINRRLLTWNENV